MIEIASYDDISY